VFLHTVVIHIQYVDRDKISAIIMCNRKLHCDLDLTCPGLDLGSPGLDSRGPGLDWWSPGLDLRGPGLDLRGPGLDLRGPGLDLRGPRLDLAGPGLMLPCFSSMLVIQIKYVRVRVNVIRSTSRSYTDEGELGGTLVGTQDRGMRKLIHPSFCTDTGLAGILGSVSAICLQYIVFSCSSNQCHQKHQQKHTDEGDLGYPGGDTGSRHAKIMRPEKCTDTQHGFFGHSKE
jgi:hypothetical protein